MTILRKLTSRKRTSRKRASHRVKKGGRPPNPCEHNREPIVQNPQCNGEVDLVDTITDGYCIGMNCIDKKSIQQLRLAHIVPRKDNYTRAIHKTKPGDFLNPWNKSLITNQQVLTSGIADPTTETEYMNDEQYSSLVQEYNESIEQKKAFDRIGVLGKSILESRVGFNRVPPS